MQNQMLDHCPLKTLLQKVGEHHVGFETHTVSRTSLGRSARVRAMSVTIAQLSADGYEAYGTVSPVFVARSALECELLDDGLGGILLREKPITAPYRKYGGDEENPSGWAKRYDLSRWGIFLAAIDGQPVGGAAVAPPSPGMIVADAGDDIAVLWDLRVSPAQRRRGIGAALLHRCTEWARDKGYRVLGIETQNVNVPACRFYAKNGGQLAAIDRFAYSTCPGLEHEAMLIWHLTL